MRRIRPGVAILALAVVIPATPGRAHATDRHWNAASGVWTASADWTPSGVPGPSDNAIVDYFSNGTAGAVAISTTTNSAVTSVTVLNGGTVSMYDARSGSAGSILCGTDFIVG